MSFSINSYSTIASRNGVGGLMSGMDTDELVEKMTTGTREKIKNQLSKKQTTMWKQEAYRDVIDSANSFQQKWLSFSAGKNNIASPSFFDTKTITSSSEYLDVSGSASAAERIQINDIKQLAETATMTSNDKLSSQTLSTGYIETGWVASTVNGQSIDVTLDGQGYAIRVSNGFGYKNNPDHSKPDTKQQLEQLAADFNKTIDATAALKGKIKFEVTTDGKMTIKSLPQKDADGNEIKGPVLDVLASKPENSDLITALGFDSADTDETTGDITGTKKGDTTDITEDKTLNGVLSGSTIMVSFNGISKNITFNDQPNPGTNFNNQGALKSYLQKNMDKLYGSNKVIVDLKDGEIKMNTVNNTDIVTIDGSDNKAVMGEFGALRINAGTSNRVVWNIPVKDISNQLGADFMNAFDANGKAKLEINGTSIEFSNEDSLTKILKKINDSDAGVTASYSTTADTFNIVAKDSGAKGFVKDPASFITDKTGTLGAALFGKYTTDATNNQSFTAGQDAIIKVSLDGGKTETELTRSTNKFSFDGLNIVLKGKNPDDSKPENIKFKVETHDEEIVTKIKEFISDYNKVIKNANDKIIDRKTKEDREFGPLTDEQKKEMSEDEVKAYEKRAKVGILQNDPHLSKMIQSFRTAMSDAVGEKALWKIGISTSADDWQSNGNLVIDEKKLETALAKDPQGVAELFTKTVEPDLSQALTPQQKKEAEKKAAMAGGISGRISFMVNASCGTSGGDGLLVSIAGKKGSPNNSDRLSNQLKQIDTTLANLKKTLQKEETRYFKQFTNMETYLNKMNMQSSWLNEQYGGN